MKSFFCRSILLVLLLISLAPILADERGDLNVTLMRSTFKIQGEGSVGTVFIMGKPTPTPESPNLVHYVLITADHVLNGIRSDKATLILREKNGDIYNRMPFDIAIRDKGEPLWTTIENADVAVMYIGLPENADLLLASTDLLADEEDMQNLELRPGDQLFCLGYPLLAESNEAGFPILRSGIIASYPLIPTSTVRSFLFDANIFEGNSGGPVYFVDSNRSIGGSTHLGTQYRMVVGLVSQQQIFSQKYESLRETREERIQLGLGIVVEATLIRAAIDKLGPPPQDHEKPNSSTH